MIPENRPQAIIVGLTGAVLLLLGAVGFLASRTVAPPPAPATPSSSPTGIATPENAPTPRAAGEPGKIVFGESLRRRSIQSARTRFYPSTPFAYVATATEPFGATELEATLAEKSGRSDEGTERPVRRWKIEVPGPEDNLQLASRETAAEFVGSDRPGRYVFRLIRAGKTLCRGEFVVREASTPEPAPTPTPDASQENKALFSGLQDIKLRYSESDAAYARKDATDHMAYAASTWRFTNADGSAENLDSTMEYLHGFFPKVSSCSLETTIEDSPEPRLADDAIVVHVRVRVEWEGAKSGRALVRQVDRWQKKEAGWRCVRTEVLERSDG